MYQVVRYGENKEKVIAEGSFQECVKFLKERYKVVKDNKYGAKTLRMLGSDISDGFDYSVGTLHVQYYIRD